MRILYVILVFLLISCEGKTKFKKPEDLIPKDQMVDMMVDLHIAAGARSVENIYEETNQNYTHLVFQKYQIDSTRFAKSNLYYLSEINLYKEMYEEIEKRINEQVEVYRAEIDSISEEESNAKRKSDSIKKTRKLESAKKDSLK